MKPTSQKLLKVTGRNGIERERNKDMKRIITLLLAVLMLALSASLVACTDKEDGNTDSTVEGSQTQNSVHGEGPTALGIPNDLKFNDVFPVLVWHSWVDEFGTTPYRDGDAVEQAVYERDTYIEDLLGLELEYQQIDGNYEARYSFNDTIRKSIMIDNKSWDLISGYSMCPPQLALEGYLVDLNTADYIDFDKSWYPEFMTEACTIDGKTYFITGDISTNSLYAMQGVAFSSSVAADNGINENDLYQLVYDNQWTIEKMFELCEDLGRPGSDGIWDESDFYPIVTSNEACIDSFYYAAGLKVIDQTEEGGLKISDDLMSEAAMDIYSMIYVAKNTSKSFDTHYNELKIVEKKCIFSLSPVINFRVYWNDAAESFRILPFPKYQKNDPYQTYLSMWCSQYCIPRDIDEPDRSAAVMEAMGYANYHQVTPVIFEETMKLRYSENEDCSNMFDIMRNGRTYEIASLFGIAFEGKGASGYAFLRHMAVYNETDWVSTYNSTFKPNLTRVVGELNTFFSK